MSRILQIAWRDFRATVLTKGFLLGMLMVPVSIALMLILIPWLVKQEKSLRFDGEVMLVDPSGKVAEPLAEYLSPSALAERRRGMEQRVDQLMRGLPTGAAKEVGDAALQQALGDLPTLRVRAAAGLPAGVDTPTPSLDGAFALVVITDPALVGSAGDAAPYRLVLPEKVEERVVDELRDGLRHAIVNVRLQQAGQDPAQVRQLMRFQAPGVERLYAGSEGVAGDVLAKVMPMAFMILLFLAVITSGQLLMTSTIEEKSSRVVELLLAAVSPMQLMAGKILGAGAVAALTLAIYAALGVAGLASAAALGLLDPWLLVFLGVFFLIAFITVSAVMAAIGAAVNELREAQTLLMPVMLVLALPMMLNLPISRDPNGVLATVLSLLPPTSPMVMMLRLSSSAPPPGWQVALSIALGILGAIVAVWLAGKVFRIGLLMNGQPPNLRTLWRWIRMA